ncbi:hypothetical protein C1645_784284 [Glomus cerebriforme]|uniref:Uncharacterized protein n=1 Tax=Glomus cerebriforme TaxID=658196 RepID=A0A397SJP3_9GLOM|nr:hypothetical protein C1645_784284 [Glomus cerebriforme]
MSAYAISLIAFLFGCSLAPTIIPGLKSLVSNLEVQHEGIVEEIMRHSRDQIKLVSLPESVVTWLRCEYCNANYTLKLRI